MIESYIEELTEKTLKQIKSDIDGVQVTDLFDTHFLKNISEDATTRHHFLNFQLYYFKTLVNSTLLNFREFRKHYSLRGVDLDYLDKLNKNKTAILSLIETGNLSELYFQFFDSQDIKYNETTKKKNLGSFFTKLVHTFKPDEYTPVDIPMRNHFNLENESYYIAMIALSRAFLIWAKANKHSVEVFRKKMTDYLFEVDKNLPASIKITDIKIMNTIYWSIANKNNSSSSDIN